MMALSKLEGYISTNCNLPWILPHLISNRKPSSKPHKKITSHKHLRNRSSHPSNLSKNTHTSLTTYKSAQKRQPTNFLPNLVLHSQKYHMKPKPHLVPTHFTPFHSHHLHSKKQRKRQTNLGRKRIVGTWSVGGMEWVVEGLTDWKADCLTGALGAP